MKKLTLFLALVSLTACSNDETIKEVEVIKEVPVIVDNTAPNVLLQTENYLKTHSNGYGSDNVMAVLKTQIKACLDEGGNYQFLNLYIGGKKYNTNNDIYGHSNTVTVVFFKNLQTQEVRVYTPNGDNSISYVSEYTTKQTNYPFASDFFKNEFIGSITTDDFLKI